jgi:excisionase family DNA binding protein
MKRMTTQKEGPRGVLLHTVPEACAIGGFSRSELYRRLAAGDLEAVKLGRATRITAESLRRMVARLPRATFAA